MKKMTKKEKKEIKGGIVTRSFGIGSIANS